MWKDQKKIISWREMRLKAKKNHFTSGINVELYMIFNFEYIKNHFDINDSMKLCILLL